MSPLALDGIDPTHAPLDQGQLAVLAAFATFAGGGLVGLAGLAGQNAMAGATAVQNEALNNNAEHWEKPGQQNEGEKFVVKPTPKGAPVNQAQQGGGGGTDAEAVTVRSSASVAGAVGRATNTPAIQFGANDNQSYHTFRHVISGGYDATAVQNAVTGNLNSIGPSLPKGYTTAPPL
ncbi:hypothetical protein LFL97_41100 (plasmid) [Burkholderia sp. JSH-S8]|nr:hypothetical protein LFL97_41100 [Burkholderia sp. JSH-S8]